MWTIIYKKKFFYKYWIENVKWYPLKFWSPIALDYVFWASDTQNEKTESEPKFLFSWLQVEMVLFNFLKNWVKNNQLLYLLDQGLCTTIMPRLISKINLKINPGD